MCVCIKLKETIEIKREKKEAK